MNFGGFNPHFYPFLIFCGMVILNVTDAPTGFGIAPNGQVEYYLSDENLATDSFFQAPCIISENRVHMGTPKVDEAYRFPIHKVMVFWVFRGIPVSWTNMYDVMMSFASYCFAFPLKP